MPPKSCFPALALRTLAISQVSVTFSKSCIFSWARLGFNVIMASTCSMYVVYNCKDSWPYRPYSDKVLKFDVRDM